MARQNFVRIVGKGVAVLAAAVAGILGLATVGIYVTLEMDNRHYAAHVFDGVVPYTSVIGSRQWHPLLSGGSLNCTYAVVTLGESASAAPPLTDNGKIGSKPREWRLAFAGDWQKTPLKNARHIRTQGTAGYQCSPYPGDRLIADLLRATDLPGGWYHEDSDTLYVYSKPAGVAFRFRFGD